MTIEKHETGSTLVIHDGQEFWNNHQIAALAQLGVKDAPNGDLAVYFHQCQRTGLDPFARQIYMIGRREGGGTRYTIQTGIDGFRLIGRRAADAARHSLSISSAEWCGMDGVWHDVWLASEPPAAARVTVYRNGGAFPAIALWSEYVVTTREGVVTKMWKDRGAGQLAKCAEALAWRKAFPQDLSGLYTTDEMSRANAEGTITATTPAAARGGRVAQTATLDEALAAAENEPVDAEIVVPDETVTTDQLLRLSSLMATAGLSKDDMLEEARRISGRDLPNANALTRAEADLLVDYITNGVVVDGPLIPEAAVR